MIRLMSHYNMKKIFIFALAVFIFSPGCSVFATDELPQLVPNAEEESQEKTIEEAIEETITYYGVDILVNTDNSIDVTETIRYNTSSYQERHGIYRDIYPYSSQGWKMAITNVEVVDEENNPYIYEQFKTGKKIRIKIGDPNVTFIGEKVYIIKYHATKATAQFEEFDEIYWNATGNEWQMPIHLAVVTVKLPGKTEPLQFACYQGFTGSTEGCNYAKNDEGVHVFNSTRVLNYSEGITIAVGFPKGIVNPYTDEDRASNFFERNKEWFLGALLPLLTLILSLGYWFKKGNDPKGTGVIVPQYDVPNGLTPLEAGALINQNIQNEYISAEIIYLATKGYIKINQLEEKYIGFLKSTDYELVRLKEYTDLSNDFDKKLMRGLFESDYRALSITEAFSKFKGIELEDLTTIPIKNVQSVKLSELKYVFSNVVNEILTSVADTILNKGYYSNFPKSRIRSEYVISAVVVTIFFSVFVGIFLGALLFVEKPFIPFLSAFLSCVIYIIISRYFPKKTQEGVMLEEQLLGLKEYLQIAEKDKLEFHNAPEKKPEIFEKLLPFAMVLGVAEVWAKEFDDIYSTSPSWYSSSSGTHFTATNFTHSLSSFSTAAVSSFVSTRGSGSGGGSSGGGSSGGGGGGGGGGSW